MLTAETLTPSLTSLLVPGGKQAIVSLEIRKRGVERGPSGNKKVYGDDFVHVVLCSGLSYADVATLSVRKLESLWQTKTLTKTLFEETRKVCPAITLNEVCEALQETDRSLRLPGFEGAPPAGIWAPLELDGKEVPGAKVYTGSGNLLDPRAPVKGTVYLYGIKLGERVLIPAANGQWDTKKHPKTVAKDLLKSWLPVGRFASYSLETDRVLALRTGEAAKRAAKLHQVKIDSDEIRRLFQS